MKDHVNIEKLKEFLENREKSNLIELSLSQ